jgi:hypothetical protein
MNSGRRIGARRHRAGSGQALLLSVIVLLMLALLAASVVAVVAGSVKDVAGDEARSQAQSLAMAGVRFADEMLTNSSNGADWRPALPAYLTPGDAAFSQQAYDDNWDTFEKLRGWDPVDSGAPYYVKFRYKMDPDALSNNPTVDPNQDFTDAPTDLEPKENDEVTAPHDHFLLQIKYAPNPANPLTKAIQITAIGRPGSNLNTFSTLTAYKSLGLQDYLLFVHDGTRHADLASVGVPPLDITGQNSTNPQLFSNRAAVGQAGALWPATTVNGPWGLASKPNDFIPLVLNGPVRSNLDLQMRLPAAINTIGNGWTESVEVAGRLQGLNQETNSSNDAVNTMTPDTGVSGNPDGNVELVISTTAGAAADIMSAPTNGKTAFPVVVNAERVEAPALDSYEPVTGVARWDRLSRFSGGNVQIYQGTTQITVNSGQLGYGRGIYLDNTTQRDNADQVRNTWLQPETWGGRQYVPNGALIELYPTYNFPGGTVGPAIVITRTDGSTWINTASGLGSGSPTMVFQWPNKTGNWNPGAWSATSGVPTAFPTPENGLIVAEGNVRIRGRLPASVNSGAASLDYGLTVVSRGAIYIDGPLLRPIDYIAGQVDDCTNTRIALLARDNLVINPTALAPGPLPGLVPAPYQIPANGPKDAHWVLNATGTNVIGLQVQAPGSPTAAAPATSLTAIDATGDADTGSQARCALLLDSARAALGQPVGYAGVNQVNYPGGGAPTVPGVVVPADTSNGVSVPVFLADWSHLLNAVYPLDALNINAPAPPVPLPTEPQLMAMEYEPDTFSLQSGWWPGGGQEAFVTAQSLGDPTGASGGQADAILKNLKVEAYTPGGGLTGPGLTMTVSAVMYCERGSLFVIPGDYFDPRAQLLGDVTDPNVHPAVDATGNPTNWAALRLARFKRYNYQVVVNGAIAVNSAPLPTDQGLWTDKWCYPTPGAAGGTTTGADVFDNYAGLQYNYDWGLRQTWPTGTPRANLPLVPHLPASPGLTYVGEENKA